ncbi:MAG: hypothetical protein IPK64_07175 [bacterium]|nr:hypothetical protein [bacterium]
MKKLVALLLVSMMASVAFAGLDPDTDSFGVYFDTAGNNMPCLNGQPAFVPFMAYLLLMNPASPTDGFECTVTPVGAPHFILSTTLGGTGTLDVDASPNGFACGAAANFPVVNGAALLVSWNIMLQAPGMPLEFFITKASIPSMTGDLPVVTGEGVLRRCGLTTGDVTLPVAIVNGACNVIGEEISSFGGVKSLFR